MMRKTMVGGLVLFGVVALGGFVMGWFGKGKQAAWDLATVERPWHAGAPSIYEFVKTHDSEAELPDEDDDGGPRFVAGGLDGVVTHHRGERADRSAAAMLHRALSVVLEDASAEKLAKLYQLMLDPDVADAIDPLLERLAKKQDLDVDRLEKLALWLATEAPDRGPVKAAMALLGVISGADHSALFLTLGKHEEFTLYAAVALANTTGDDAERHLFALAQQVHGWGRIHLVERLAETRSDEIKAWMLREGYRNDVMYEYLAYTCATAGGLRGALARDPVDPALLAGAGEIIKALITGGPAQDMDDYADGAAVVERYLQLLGPAPKQLEQLVTAAAIGRFLDEDAAAWTERETRGWTPARRAALRARILEVKALPHWRAAVLDDLAATDERTFGLATVAAQDLGIDTWDRHFARLEAGNGDGWYFVMQTDDAARIDRVVALAEQRLPLDRIASGPAEELGLGEAWLDHGHLDFVLQDLSRFPGKGWPLIRAGLRSPVVRNRNMALKALAAWDRAAWPADAAPLLQTALREEPDDDLRPRFEAVLAGRPL